MPEHTAKFQPGAAVSYTASGAVVGGQVVEVTGDRQVAAAAAGSTKVVGVAAFDAAQGAPLSVLSGGIHPLIASGAIAAGDQVATAAGGTVATAADGTHPIGVAITAAADGTAALIQLT